MTDTDSAHARVTGLDPDDATPDDVSRDDLRAALASPDNQTRVHAATVAARLASLDAEFVAPLTPALVDRLDDDRVAVLRDALTALAFVAETDVDRLADAPGPLVALLTHDVPVVRTFAARPLRAIALEHPEWFAAHVDALLDVAETPIQDPTGGHRPDPEEAAEFAETQQSIAEAEERRQFAARTIGVNVLVEVAATDPAAVEPHADRVVALLDSDGPGVVAAMLDVVAELAAADRDVPGARDALVDCLDSDDPAIQTRSVRALGHLDDPSAVDPLRALAANDDAPEELRDLAADTADWLAD